MFTLSPPTCFANSYMGKNEATTFTFDDCCAIGSDKLELDMASVFEMLFSWATAFSEACITKLPGRNKKENCDKENVIIDCHRLRCR